MCFTGPASLFFEAFLAAKNALNLIISWAGLKKKPGSVDFLSGSSIQFSNFNSHSSQ
jgi:hypothetical protein